jgi:hypothetical protein
MSSPDYDPGEYDRSENDDRGSGPLSSPDEMSIDSAYHYHGRQTFAQNYNGSNQSYGQPISGSPNFGTGFVPINQTYSPQPMMDQSQRGYVQSLGSDTIHIPSGPGGFSPSGNVFDLFTGQGSGYLGDVSDQFGMNTSWMDLYIPTNLATWDPNYTEPYDMQPVYSSQGGNESSLEQRRGSVYYPTVLPLCLS